MCRISAQLLFSTLCQIYERAERKSAQHDDNWTRVKCASTTVWQIVQFPFMCFGIKSKWRKSTALSDVL